MAEKFRKKPIVIEAVQYDGTSRSGADICDWIRSCNPAGGYLLAQNGPVSGLQLRTLETREGEWLTADKGDWIIRGVKGEFYPCKPDIFEATYDKEPRLMPEQPSKESLERARRWLYQSKNKYPAGRADDSLALEFDAIAKEIAVPMLLSCPSCGKHHIDEGEWETKKHRTHQCQFCGHEWRPYNYSTFGILDLRQQNAALVSALRWALKEGSNGYYSVEEGAQTFYHCKNCHAVALRPETLSHEDSCQLWHAKRALAPYAPAEGKEKP